MQKTNLNRFTSILRIKTERGFTLVEILLALSILIFILLVTPTVWSNLVFHPDTERYAVQQFFHTATDEVQQHQLAEQNNYQLILATNTIDQVIISRYNDTIRRQVNRTGHEILLRDVEQFNIDYTDRYLLIKLTMNSGMKYEKVVTLFTQ